MPTTAAEAAGGATPPVFLDPDRLLDRFGEAQIASADSIARARLLSKEAGIHPVAGLLRLNAVAETPLYDGYAAILGLPVLDGREAEPQVLASAVQAMAASLGLSAEWMALKGVVVFEQDGRWVLGFREQPDDQVCSLLLRKARLAKKELSWLLVPPSAYDPIFRVRHSDTATEIGGADLRTLRELAEEGPTIELVNSFLSQAVTHRASDVHFEAEEFEFVVRMRVDGDMLEQSRLPRDRYDAVACRLKILADLDIAERRLAQDGRINARVNGENFDIRMSVLPAVHGESIVLRLLRQERKPTRLQDLGMSAEDAGRFERWARQANGIVLVTGPTGSGKSTTLYTALELANDRSKKIVTVEDPVEYKIRGITQLQVNADIGFTFAAALRSILRHDPDIILVGEIRDEETARIAIQSALTGHLVLSTLHTNSAIGAITRLVDMGIEPFLIGASIRGLMAQRLVRRLCTHCAVPDTSQDEALAALLGRFEVGHAHPLKAVGCERCSGTGYFGRVAVYDLLEIDADIGHRIARGDGEASLLAAIGPHAGEGLLRAGVRAVAAGQTSLAEVLRAVGGG